MHVGLVNRAPSLAHFFSRSY